jgi:hypothetical protein
MQQNSEYDMTVFYFLWVSGESLRMLGYRLFRLL